MNWFRRMMYGRYGNDQFGNFLFVVYLLLFVLQRIFIRTVAAPVFALFEKYCEPPERKSEIFEILEPGKKLL